MRLVKVFGCVWCQRDHEAVRAYDPPPTIPPVRMTDGTPCYVAACPLMPWGSLLIARAADSYDA